MKQEFTKKHKENLSKANKKNWKDPMTRINRVKGIKKSYDKNDLRQKRSVTTSNKWKRYHKENPSQEYIRKQILKEKGEKCEHCGSTEKLNVHHKKYTFTSKLTLKDYLVLCPKCHAILHRKLRQQEKEYTGSNRIKRAIIEILEALKIDKKDENFRNTPTRVARTYEEIFGGLKNLDKKLKEIFDTSFPSDYDGIVAIQDIDVFSMCPHHFLPVRYKINIGIIYKKEMLGLSKIIRFVDLLAKRPVLQETFTLDIIKYLQKHISPKGIIVIIKGQHMCMTMRGIKQPDNWVTTSSVQGVFESDHIARQEFFELIKK